MSLYRLQEMRKTQHSLIFSQVVDLCKCWRTESSKLKEQLDAEKMNIHKLCSAILDQCALVSESWLSHQKKLESSLVEMRNNYVQAESRLNVEKEKNTEMAKSYEARLSAATTTEKSMSLNCFCSFILIVLSSIILVIVSGYANMITPLMNWYL